ncbi:copper amine oxidase N-terminal domain-containing protein [Paenibacillus sp. N1-5-1-14]|uniref:copper amine oxidase N-terminal domain-containing protein n=1 Tax=Paenibacillus radicibacter TaxID=2972488 RepID=UPI00215946E0|nr:copper amine oxidase N-terminal domain-containing protein [Paenibacillus radicibacter]MCR8643438.1 copper amine oxidase N-terminal domain-containing protein [Paenibacillus radicibacter]
MLKKIVLFTFVLMFSLSGLASAHSGRLDANGGHNCSAKSKAKGLCSGYHYHRGGESTESSSDTENDNDSNNNTKTQPIEKSTYIENKDAPANHCKHVTDKYEKSTQTTDYYLRVWDCNLYTDSGEQYQLSDIKVEVNGKSISFEQQPIVINGSTMVPFRVIAELLGAKVTWNGELQSITVVKSNNQIILILNDKQIKRNGDGIAMDVAPLTVNGVTLVPLRNLSEALGAKVIYISDTHTAKITTD